MILFIAKLITRFFGVDLQKAQRIAFFALLGVGLIIALLLIFQVRACLTPAPTIDEERIREATEKMRETETNRLQNTLNESANRVREIEANVRAAEEKTNRARNANYKGINGADLDKKAGNYR